MFRSMVSAGLFLSFLSTKLFAVGWISENVSVSPEFSSPSEVCSWYISTLPGEEWLFSHVSSRSRDVVRPAGRLFCYGISVSRPGSTWNIGNAFYNGSIQDLNGKDDNSYNNEAVVSDELKEVIRRSMRRFYGDQVNEWNIDFKMVQVFQKWVSKVSEGCKCFKYVPQPMPLPTLSATALVKYFVKYGKKIVSEHESEVNYSCMQAAALGMKTEFWMAGNL